MSQILVVSNDATGLPQVLRVLEAAGYRTLGASTFEQAKAALANGAPDLIIADERLDAYNGLHVIVRARAQNPDLSAIVVTSEACCGLERDARSLNVEYLIKPHTPAEWLEPIRHVLHEERRLLEVLIPGSEVALDTSWAAAPATPRL
jgi:DNA-binding response OmpR family regulator